MQVIYRDDWFIAINKPSGLLSIQDGYHIELPHAKSLLEASGKKIWPIHRLDKDTSGVLLFAASAEAHRYLSMQFEKREVTKVYIALVIGSINKDEVSIDLPLFINGDRAHRTIVDFARGKNAQTTITVLKRFNNLTLVRAIPHTGYTHQIRAHLTNIGFPIAGDSLYIPKSQTVTTFEFPVNRLALHAYSLSFFHPYKKVNIEITTPLPNDFPKIE